MESNTSLWVVCFFVYPLKSCLKLFKGSCRVTGRKSPYSLYDLNLATYEESDTFDHKAGEAFTRIWGLPLMTVASNQTRKKK